MELVIVSVGFVGGVAVVVRVAVGFLRWTRKHPPEGGRWMLGAYLRESLGDWVDGVADSHHPSSQDDPSDHGVHLHHYHSGDHS